MIDFMVVSISLFSTISFIPYALYINEKKYVDRITLLSDRIATDRQNLGDLQNKYENSECRLRNWSVLCFIEGAISGFCMSKTKDNANYVYAYVFLGSLSVFSFVKAIFTLREMNRLEDERKKLGDLNAIDQLERRMAIEKLNFNWESVKKHKEPISLTLSRL